MIFCLKSSSCTRCCFWLANDTEAATSEDATACRAGRRMIRLKSQTGQRAVYANQLSCGSVIAFRDSFAAVAAVADDCATTSVKLTLQNCCQM